MTSAVTKWILELIDRATAPLKQIKESVETTNKSVKQLQESSNKLSAIDYYAVSQSVQDLTNQINQAVQPGIEFQDNLADVEAITGVTGKALDELGDKARQSALDFGGQASDSLNTYKTILSRLGPDIAKSQTALAGMEENVRVLSKTMNNDASAAVDALTTSLLQYKVDLSDPIKAQKTMNEMMNVMAAGAKEGAAEVPDISSAIKVAGVEAKKSNVSFIETNAALQELAKGGKKGAEAGTALRNVLGKMAGADVIPKAALKKLESYGVNMDIVSDTTLPFTTRLRELGKAQSDATAFAQVFGVENSAAANILISSADAQEELQAKITDTNVAYEQAEVKMATYSERMSRWKAQLNDIGISFFNATENALPFINAAGVGMQTFANWKAITEGFSGVFKTQWMRSLIVGKTATNRLSFANIKSGFSAIFMAKSTSAAGRAAAVATAPTFAFSTAIRSVGVAIMSIPVVGWILAIVTALIALFRYLWNNFGEFRGSIYGIWNVIKLVFGKIWGLVQPIVIGLWNSLINTFRGIWIVTKHVFTSIWNVVKSTFVNIWNTIKFVFTSIWQIVSVVFTTVSTFLKKHFVFIFKLFKQIFGGIYDFFKGVFDSMYNVIMGTINAIVGAIKKAWKWLKGFFGEANEAYNEGMQRGKKEVAERKQKKNAKKEHEDLEVGVNELLSPKAQSTKLNLTDLAQTKSDTPKTKLNISGSGSNSGSKNITQNLTVNNYLSVASEFDLHELADKVAGMFNDRLRDGAIALD